MLTVPTCNSRSSSSTPLIDWMALTIKFNVGAGSTRGAQCCKPELHTLGAFGTLQVSLDSIGLAEKNFDGHCHI